MSGAFALRWYRTLLHTPYNLQLEWGRRGRKMLVFKKGQGDLTSDMYSLENRGEKSKRGEQL